MNELTVTINNTELPIKEYQGRRVVTFKEIDAVHKRPEGTARRNFNTNKEHFIEEVDFFKITADEFRTALGRMDARQQTDVTLITESGYLMLVKSFQDDLAWTVQRQLVNVYFCATDSQRKNAAQQSQRQSVKRPALSSINGAMKITIEAMKAAGMAPEYIALTVRDTYKPYGINIPDGCLPESEKLYECEAIAQKLGILSEKGKPHKQAVSAVIGLVGTSDGETRTVPFTQGGYSNTTVKYTHAVLERVQGWLEAHGWPTVIQGADGKNYKVRYQVMACGEGQI